MGLNYLYHRQQVSAFNADNAACERSRKVHRTLEAAYGALILAKRTRRAGGRRADATAASRVMLREIVALQGASARQKKDVRGADAGLRMVPPQDGFLTELEEIQHLQLEHRAGGKGS